MAKKLKTSHLLGYDLEVADTAEESFLFQSRKSVMKTKKTVPITKISIENVSKWPTMYATLMVNGLLQADDDRDYILSHRDVGCTFRHKDGVNIGVLPVSKAYPEDTLFFYIHDREGKE